MGDLISRSALLKYLRDYKWEFALGSDFSKAIEMVDVQPTAYDVDKVVEELESRAEANEYVSVRLKGSATKRQRDSWLQRASAFRKAIEIVKGGGVNERD